MERTAWPDQVVVRPLICAYFLVVLSILTTLCTLRIASVGTFRRFWRISLARKLILLTLLDSWLFAYASAVLLFGIGASLNKASCMVGIMWCILLYASSKVMIYIFLLERLHICHSSIKQQDATFKDRFQSWWYRVGAVLLAGWLVVAALMLAGRNAELSIETRKCKIGLKIWATVPMLVVDAVVNLFLTAGFVAPVAKAGFRGASSLLKTSCLASSLALVTSFVNILILAIMHGHQQSYICLSSCVFDVAANACILFVITRHPAKGEGLSRTNAEEGIRTDNHGTASMAQVGTARPSLSTATKRQSATLVNYKQYIPTFPAFNESAVSLRISPSPSMQIHTDGRRHTSTLISHSTSTEQLPLARPAKAFMFEGIQISRTTQSTVDGPDGAEKAFDEPVGPEVSESMPFVVSLEKELDTPDEKEQVNIFARKDA